MYYHLLKPLNYNRALEEKKKAFQVEYVIEMSVKAKVEYRLYDFALKETVWKQSGKRLIVKYMCIRIIVYQDVF